MIASLVISPRQLPQEKLGQPSIFSGEPAHTLHWLASRLRALGLISEGVPVTKNTRSSVDVVVFAQRYRLRSANSDCSDSSATVRLQKRVPLLDRLLGRDALDANDAFVRVLQDMLEREPVVERVEVSWT